MLDHPGDTMAGWASASLRVASDSLAPEQISELLGLRPTTARQSDGQPSFTVWLHESFLDSRADIADHLFVLVEELAERRDAVRELASLATVEIWLTWSAVAAPGRAATGPAVLPSELLRDVADMGIDLVIESYTSRESSR